MPSGPPAPRRRLFRAIRLLFQGTLSLLLILQLHLLHEGGVRVPSAAARWLFRQAEERGFSIRTGDIWLDPRGRLLIIAPKLGLRGSSEFASARAVALQLRRRALLRGELELTRVEVAGLELTLPALQSPTGADQPVLSGGEFRLGRGSGADAWSVEQASARLLDIPTAFAGVLPSSTATPPAPRKAATTAAADALSQVSGVYRRLTGLPLDSVRRLRIDFSGEGLAVAADLPALLVPAHPALPDALNGSVLAGVKLVLSAPLDDPEGVTLLVEADSISSPPALGLSSGPLVVRVRRDGDGGLHGELAARELRKTDLPLPPAPLLATVDYLPGASRLEARIATRLADAAWTLTLAGAPGIRSGVANAEGVLTPALLEVARPHLPEKARPVLRLTDPVALALQATLAPGGAPERVLARASAGRAVAGNVRFDRASARLVYEPAARRLLAEDLLLVQDDARAEGSYEMDTETLAFRFLLGGRLRPMGIEGWFSGWWDALWAGFAFGPVPPEAEVDVRGRWREARRTTVYVGARSGPLRVRELDLDSLDTRVQVNPGGSVDLLGFRATRGPHLAAGSFSRTLAEGHDSWSRIRFDIRSDFPLSALPAIFPGEGAQIAAPFELQDTPTIHLAGETHGPGSATPGRQTYTLEASTYSPLRYRGFPLDHLSTRLEREDDEIRLDPLRAGFADGVVTGRATLSGPATDRWLAFDLTLLDASLELALQRWREYEATLPGQAAPEPKDEKKLGGRLDLALAATGPAYRPLAFAGRGHAHIVDADLARIRLLGGFSTLLSDLGIGIATLKLTDADTPFELAQNRLRFDDLRLTGPSALVEADGVYQLSDGRLEFTAKLKPFERRTGLLSSTADFVLTPLSSVLEIALAGKLDEPAWTFSYGPMRLLRKITGSGPKPLDSAPSTVGESP